MEAPDLFRNLSPLDHRYYLSNKELFEQLQQTLSEEAAIRYCITAEAALLKAHISFHLPGRVDLSEQVDCLHEQISPAEVYQEEEKTHHNIRALVNVIKARVSSELRTYVHLGATSVDILDTAQSMRIRDAVRNTLLPLLIELEGALIAVARKESATPQIGRTHGQHAVPITFGFAVAEYVARLGKSISEIERRSGDLRGKLAGAVGAYNATSLLVSDPVELEQRYLAFLGLAPAEYSTQLVEPEYLLRLLLELNVAFGIIANLADDLRNLQRSEIAEVHESFTATQVGSSTMPQKRNPWNSEHVKSLWKAFSPRVITFYMDQISEHQRDLTNSASSRFVAEYIAGFAAAVNRMHSVVTSLGVDAERMAANLAQSGTMVLAEPAYILLSLSGDADAHETIRRVTLAGEKTGTSFMEELKRDQRAWKSIRAKLQEVTGVEAEEFFSKPSLYAGRAEQRALSVCQRQEAAMNAVRSKLHASS